MIGFDSEKEAKAYGNKNYFKPKIKKIEMYTTKYYVYDEWSKK